MKKSLLIAAMAGFALVSCTENDLDNSVKVQEPISFSAPVVKPNTKAASEIGSVYDDDLSFRVWGHYYTDEYNGFSNGQVYINNALCNYNDANKTWIPKNNAGKTYYWPKNGTLTFIAYHPATTANVTVGADGLTITDYTVNNTDNSAMEDLMFSERAYNMKMSWQGDLNDATSSPYAGVDLQFRHALASIAFNAKLDKAYDGTVVTITGISLTGVVSTATFKQNLNDADDATTKTDLLTTGTSTLKASWTPSGTKAAYTVDFADPTTPKVLSTTEYWPCTNLYTTATPTESGNFRATDLMLIPQDVSGVKLIIYYTIKTPDSSPIVQSYEANLTGTWNIGYRYVYNITFGFDPITFAPTVDVWEPVGNTVDGKAYMNE